MRSELAAQLAAHVLHTYNAPYVRAQITPLSAAFGLPHIQILKPVLIFDVFPAQATISAACMSRSFFCLRCTLLTSVMSFCTTTRTGEVRTALLLYHWHAHHAGCSAAAVISMKVPHQHPGVVVRAVVWWIQRCPSAAQVQCGGDWAAEHRGYTLVSFSISEEERYMPGQSGAVRMSAYGFERRPQASGHHIL